MNSDRVSESDSDFVIDIGGVFVTEALTGDDHIGLAHAQMDMLRIHAFQSRDHRAIFYEHELDDLITALVYWRDYRPGRGRNVRSEI